MTSEKSIAEENISLRNCSLGGFLDSISIIQSEDKNKIAKCETHKATCQRFLEFLEDLEGRWQPDGIKHKDKITDLKQAIKLYTLKGINEDAGIK